LLSQLDTSAEVSYLWDHHLQGVSFLDAQKDVGRLDIIVRYAAVGAISEDINYLLPECE
jgi:hypothetical protein